MIIDADSHYIPLDVYKYVDNEYKLYLPSYVKNQDHLLEVILTKDPNPWSHNPLPAHFHNAHPGFYDLDARIRDFKKLHVDFQILNPQEHAMRFGYRVNQDLAVQMASSWNRVLLDIINIHPDKFHGPLLLPLQNVEWCLSEIDWGIRHGFSSVMIDTAWVNDSDSYCSLLLEMPEIEKIFRKCADNDVLLSFHNQMHHSGFVKNAMLTSYRVSGLFPSNQKLLLITLITSGVFDRYPNLKALFSEGGMGFVMESLNYLENTLKIPSKKYFQKNLWFTIETEETTLLKYLITLIGSDRFLFATDYPHDDPGGEMKFQDWSLIDQLDIDKSQLEDICYRNALNIFQLDKSNFAS